MTTDHMNPEWEKQQADVRSKIFDDVEAERRYQDSKWGVQFDRRNTLNDWVTFIAMYAGKAAEYGRTPEEQRRYMVKVAALAVAALERNDELGGFPPRHYDPTV